MCHRLLTATWDSGSQHWTPGIQRVLYLFKWTSLKLRGQEMTISLPAQFKCQRSAPLRWSVKQHTAIKASFHLMLWVYEANKPTCWSVKPVVTVTLCANFSLNQFSSSEFCHWSHYMLSILLFFSMDVCSLLFLPLPGCAAVLPPSRGSLSGNGRSWHPWAVPFTTAAAWHGDHNRAR